MGVTLITNKRSRSESIETSNVERDTDENLLSASLPKRNKFFHVISTCLRSSVLQISSTKL